MPIEQPVVASASRSAGLNSGRQQTADPAPAPKPKKRSKRLLVVGVLVVVALAAAYFLLLKPAGGKPAPAPVPGTVLTVDAVSVNLADGHYLRLGMGLQLTADVGKESPDPARALDLAIDLFSGQTLAQVSDPAVRRQLKAELAKEVAKAYDGEVMGVYLTDYVTQ